MTNNIKKNKNQHNEAIENEPKFDNIFGLSNGNKYPLPVVTVSLISGKKQRAMVVAGIKCLWDSGATNSTIKRKYTEYYECRMRFNKVEYSTAAGLYFTTHNIKLPFFMSEISSIKIIYHRFHVNNNKGGSGIGYDMTIGRDLMVQLGLLDYFKRQVLQLYGVTVPMK